MKKNFLFLFLMQLFCINSFAQDVGEIVFDEKTDDPTFKVADSFKIFAKPRYEGEKPSIINYFREKYKSNGLEQVNGYVTVKFFVDHDGKAGKFRMQTMGLDYQPVNFDQGISEQILSLIKAFKNWTPLLYMGKAYGYYTYVNFRIINGEIKEITP